jgi:hypothetical protein
MHLFETTDTLHFIQNKTSSGSCQNNFQKWVPWVGVMEGICFSEIVCKYKCRFKSFRKYPDLVFQKYNQFIFFKKQSFPKGCKSLSILVLLFQQHICLRSVITETFHWVGPSAIEACFLYLWETRFRIAKLRKVSLIV